MACAHPLCERIGGACSLDVTRSRGCRPRAGAGDLDDAVIDEIRALLDTIDEEGAAPRLAQLVRREAMEGRSVVALARHHDLDIADRLAALCARREP